MTKYSGYLLHNLYLQGARRISFADQEIPNERWGLWFLSKIFPTKPHGKAYSTSRTNKDVMKKRSKNTRENRKGNE